MEEERVIVEDLTSPETGTPENSSVTAGENAADVSAQTAAPEGAAVADVSEGAESVNEAAAGVTEQTEAAAAAAEKPVTEAAEKPADAVTEAENTAAETEEAAAKAENTAAETEEAAAEAEETAAQSVEADEAETAGKKKMSRTGKGFLIAGCVILGLAALLAAAGLIVYNVFYMRSNFGAVVDESAAEAAAETMETVDPAVQASIQAERQAIADSIEASRLAAKNESTEKSEKLHGEGVKNILLIGSDHSEWGIGNSDAIIVCSINYDTRKIYLTSIMRDTAADVPGRGVTKINSACAIGGPELLVETVENNFMIEIDNYALVDFEAMKQVIDALGGVDMMITVKEAEFMKIEIEEDQVLHLDGRLALRHSRDRSSGGSDFGRVQRQKDVLLAIIDKARSGGIRNLTQAAYACLPYITHDMTRTDLFNIIIDLPQLIDFEFVQLRFPYNDLYHFEGEFIVLDTAQTIARWNETVYSTGEETEDGAEDGAEGEAEDSDDAASETEADASESGED